MYDDLIALVQGRVSDELYDSLIAAVEVLNELDVWQQEIPLENLYHTVEQGDPLELPSRVVALIENTQIAVLNNFGVQLNEGISLDQLTQVLQTLQWVESHEDRESVLAICESSDDPELKLAELVEFFTQARATDYLPLFEDVSAMLIQRLIEVLSRAETLQEAVASRETAVRTARDRLAGYVQNRPLMIAEAVSEGLPLGLPVPVLMTHFTERFETADFKPRQAVEELLGILASSELPTEALREVCSAELEELYGEPRFLQDANLVLNQVIQEFAQHG